MSSLYIIDIYPSSDRLSLHFSLSNPLKHKPFTFLSSVTLVCLFFSLVCGLDALAKKFLPISTKMYVWYFFFFYLRAGN